MRTKLKTKGPIKGKKPLSSRLFAPQSVNWAGVMTVIAMLAAAFIGSWTQGADLSAGIFMFALLAFFFKPPGKMTDQKIFFHFGFQAALTLVYVKVASPYAHQLRPSFTAITQDKNFYGPFIMLWVLFCLVLNQWARRSVEKLGLHSHKSGSF